MRRVCNVGEGQTGVPASEINLEEGTGTKRECGSGGVDEEERV